ncbi:MAG TPA: DNA translocase FtsK, partial [Sulfitobacter sp.]|nr:DNA translocase FtsK [Sulfitobacter sp.]
MAYQTRGRDPLLDSNMAEAIEKRGRELLGLALIMLGIMAAMMIGSYTPDDPNWMVSTDAPVQNWMGRIGASIAAPLFMIVGWGAWGIAIVLLFWGGRFALHQGDDRALGRLIFAPIAVALGAIYAATLAPGQEWLLTHSFGLGGLFGDTVMGALLTVLPIGSTLTVKLMSLLMGVAILALGAFVLGFTKAELMRITRFLLVGLIMAYAGLMTLLGRGASGAVVAAQNLSARQAERRERRRQEAEEAETWAAQDAGQDYYAQQAPMPEPEAEPRSLFGRMPGLIKRPEADDMPEPELIETYSDAIVDETPGEERIKSKIADVIKNRVRNANAIHTPTTAPLTKGRGRGPDPLLLNTSQPATLRAEPPLTAGAATLRPEPLLRKPQVQPEPAPEPMVEEPMMQEPMVERYEDTVTSETLPLQQTPAPEAMKIPVAEPRKVVQQPTRKPVQPSKQAQVEAQPTLTFDDTHPGFELPPLSL